MLNRLNRILAVLMFAFILSSATPVALNIDAVFVRCVKIEWISGDKRECSSLYKFKGLSNRDIFYLQMNPEEQFAFGNLRRGQHYRVTVGPGDIWSEYSDYFSVAKRYRKDLSRYPIHFFLDIEEL